MSDSDNEDFDDENTEEEALEDKEPWQVMSCPQCKAPPGMRCKGNKIGVIVHGIRRKKFMELLEKEGLLEKNQKGKGWHRTKKNKYFGQKKDSEESADQHQRNHDPSSIDKSSEDGIPPWEDLPTQKNNEPAPSWGNLAAKLRKEKGIKPMEKQQDAVTISDEGDTAEIHHASPASPPMDVVGEMKGPNLSDSSAVTKKPQLKFAPRLENQAIWQKIPCPTCHATPGKRCADTLGEARFASHQSRVHLFHSLEN